MVNKILLLFLSFLLWLSFISCEIKTDYQQLVEREYQEGAENDSLFLGYHFGMTKQQFFDHSWKLNKQKLVWQGESNRSIRYEVDYLKSRAKMNFYPVFRNDSIFSMPVQYSYSGWAPWNKDLWADSLEQDLMEHFQQKFGYDFQRMEHPEKKKPAYITIEGNKRIAIFQPDNHNNQIVALVYTDLNVVNRLNEESNDE